MAKKTETNRNKNKQLLFFAVNTTNLMEIVFFLVSKLISIFH